MQEWLTVAHYLAQDVVRATRLSHEQPIVPILVVDGESVVSEREVNPSLCDVVGEKLRNSDSVECAEMVS